jgi:hypothetical protein
MNDFSRRAFIFGGAGAISLAVFITVDKLGSYALAERSAESTEGAVTIVEFGDAGQRIGPAKR